MNLSLKIIDSPIGKLKLDLGATTESNKEVIVRPQDMGCRDIDPKPI